MVWKVAPVKSPSKRNNFWKGFKISRLADFSNRFELTSGLTYTCSKMLRCALKYKLGRVRGGGGGGGGRVLN